MSEETCEWNWYDILELVQGEEVTIIPRDLPGQMLQGTLVALIVSDTGPVMVLIRQAEGKPINTIPWGAICMITKSIVPLAATEAASSVAVPSVADLVAMAGDIGLDVPDDIRAMLDSPSVD